MCREEKYICVWWKYAYAVNFHMPVYRIIMCCRETYCVVIMLQFFSWK